LAGYLVPGNSHIGAVIGRYADEIRNAQFTLARVTYHLPPMARRQHDPWRRGWVRQESLASGSA